MVGGACEHIIYVLSRIPLLPQCVVNGKRSFRTKLVSRAFFPHQPLLSLSLSRAHTSPPSQPSGSATPSRWRCSFPARIRPSPTRIRWWRESSLADSAAAWLHPAAPSTSSTPSMARPVGGAGPVAPAHSRASSHNLITLSARRRRAAAVVEETTAEWREEEEVACGAVGGGRAACGGA